MLKLCSLSQGYFSAWNNNFPSQTWHWYGLIFKWIEFLSLFIRNFVVYFWSQISHWKFCFVDLGAFFFSALLPLVLTSVKVTVTLLFLSLFSKSQFGQKSSLALVLAILLLEKINIVGHTTTFLNTKMVKKRILLIQVFMLIPGFVKSGATSLLQS